MVARYSAQDSEGTIFTTELNSLADGSNKLSTAISNDAASTERRLFANFRLTLATQGAARDTGAAVALYIIPEVGGTYAMGDDTTDPEQGLRGRFKFDAATTAREQVLEDVRLPSGDFKVLLINETGQAFASTGNTLKYERYGYEDV